MPQNPTTRAYEHTDIADKTRFEMPKFYSISIHNDDYTPMDFVVMLLMKVFRKSPEDAEEIMLDVHTRGVRVVGVYSYDIAITKRAQGQQMANLAGHPLKITIEEVAQ